MPVCMCIYLNINKSDEVTVHNSDASLHVYTYIIWTHTKILTP